MLLCISKAKRCCDRPGCAACCCMASCPLPQAVAAHGMRYTSDQASVLWATVTSPP